MGQKDQEAAAAAAEDPKGADQVEASEVDRPEQPQAGDQAEQPQAGGDQEGASSGEADQVEASEDDQAEGDQIEEQGRAVKVRRRELLEQLEELRSRHALRQYDVRVARARETLARAEAEDPVAQARRNLAAAIADRDEVERTLAELERTVEAELEQVRPR